MNILTNIVVNSELDVYITICTGLRHSIIVLPKNTQHLFFLNVCCVMVFYVFCVVLCVGFCTGHFVTVPLNLTCLHCLQYSFFEHLFNFILYIFCAPESRAIPPYYHCQVCTPFCMADRLKIKPNTLLCYAS